MATIENRIVELERQYCVVGFKLVLRLDNESDYEARARAGLADWQ